MEKPNDIVPMMTVGKYKGTRVDALTTSYCRWLLTHNFPEEILKYARRKVESNKTTDLPMEVTRYYVVWFFHILKSWFCSFF